MEYQDEMIPNEEVVANDGEQEEIQFFAEAPESEEDSTSYADADMAGDSFETDFGSDDSEKETKCCGAIGAAAEDFRERLQTLRTNCRALSERLADDWKATNGNPYIRSTTTYRYEVLRNSKDTEPVDVFEFQRTSGASLRAMALTAAIVAAADVTVARAFHHWKKK